MEPDEHNAEVNATVFDLLTVFQKILSRHKEEVKMEIHREEISLADMIRNLKTRLFAAGELSVVEFFETLGSKRELVTAFVAVLEIVRTDGVRLFQRKTFADIILRAENIG